MDFRTRFIRSLSFDTSVPPLFWHMFGLMPRVLERWHSDGLPSSINEERIAEYFGFDGYGWMRNAVTEDGKSHSMSLPFPVGFEPAFPAWVIEDTTHHLVSTDALGRVTKLIKGISTLPRVVEYPFKKPSDWPQLKKRLRYSKRRLKGDWLKKYEEMRSQGLLIAASLLGFFWFPRDLMGELTLSRAYFENPNLVHDILGTYSDLVVAVAEQMLASIEIDAVSFAEDMAYKHGPMISPKLFSEFMLPYYRKVIKLFRRKATRIFCVDTDGNLDVLIPLFIEAGINVIGPVEVQAGNDLTDLRRRFGTKMAYFGGLDKRALLQSTDAINAEVDTKVQAMLKTGGYNIGLDHRVLPRTPLKNFEYYVQRVREILNCPRNQMDNSCHKPV